MQVTYPPAIHAAAKRLGVTLPQSEEVDGFADVVQMGTEFGADFGGLSFKKLGRSLAGLVKKRVTKVASKGTASAIVKGSAVAFGLRSKKVTPAAAMAAADRLLGDPKIANAQAVVRNTHALAALGDPAAKRGLAVLQAVGNIRTAKNAPPGKKVIPAPAAPTRAVTIKRTPAQVRRMAAKTPVAATPKPPATTPKKQLGIIKRILIKIGFAHAA